MIEKLELKHSSIFYKPELHAWELNGMHFFLDGASPNWIVTDERGACILDLIDGKNDFSALIRIYSREYKIDPAKAWLHVHTFLQDALARNMAGTKPFEKLIYQGRGRYCAVVAGDFIAARIGWLKVTGAKLRLANVYTILFKIFSSSVFAPVLRLVCSFLKVIYGNKKEKGTEITWLIACEKCPTFKKPAFNPSLKAIPKIVAIIPAPPSNFALVIFSWRFWDSVLVVICAFSVEDGEARAGIACPDWPAKD